MKKGFTLMELLGAIVIIGIIATIVFIIVTDLVSNSTNKMYVRNENLMKEKAKTYAFSSDFVFPTVTGTSSIIELSTLREEGLIERILDPKDNSIVCDGKVYVYKALDNSFEYIPYLECGTNYKTSNVSYSDSDITSISHTSSGNNHTITITLNTNHKVGNIYTNNLNVSLYKPTLVDYTVWNVGTFGSQGTFAQNGVNAENQIVVRENPWGRQDIVWGNISNDITSDADGGWNNNGRSVNSNSTYRLSVWIKREDLYSSTTPSVVTGRTYFGTQASTVQNLGTTTTNTNPYFGNYVLSELPAMQNNWLLWVAHIHASGYAGTSSPLSGVYKLDGTRLIGLTDYKWIPGQTLGGHRAYLFYSTSVNEKQYYYRPRMEIVDSNTPSIQDLLKGYENPDINGATITTSNIITSSVSGKGIFPITFKTLDGKVKIIPYIIN
jgi:prepilin-type N-terminal cleavage/methylation domain-containing protein